MKISFRERRSSKYQNRIFVLLLLMAAVPLLVAGTISYKIYMDEVTKQTDLSMEAIETQIYNDVEVVLSSIRQSRPNPEKKANEQNAPNLYKTSLPINKTCSQSKKPFFL